MSDYKKMVQAEAESFLEHLGQDFEKDTGEHGGGSAQPNISKWLDANRRLFEHMDEVTKNWTRAEFELVRHNSRNSVAYGDPKESAYFAHYKDVLAALKKLEKKHRGA